MGDMSPQRAVHFHVQREEALAEQVGEARETVEDARERLSRFREEGQQNLSAKEKVRSMHGACLTTLLRRVMLLLRTKDGTVGAQSLCVMNSSWSYRAALLSVQVETLSKLESELRTAIDDLKRVHELYLKEREARHSGGRHRDGCSFQVPMLEVHLCFAVLLTPDMNFPSFNDPAEEKILEVRRLQEEAEVSLDLLCLCSLPHNMG